MSRRLAASFKHYGIAPFEVEALFSILNGAFVVQEKEVERDYSVNYACMIDINFPLEFNENFFDILGYKRWDKITFLIKEMRRRTGNKGVKISMHFTGNPALSFTIAMHEENLFGFAFEKMEILNELIAVQTNSGKLPKDVHRMHYEFDPAVRKWYPKTAWSNGTIFRYDDGEWIISNEL